MIWRVLIILITILVTSCSFLRPDDPSVSEETLVQVLVELHLLDARSDRRGTSVSALRDSIFTQYGISEAEFQEALKHYSRNPEELSILYNTVMDSLNASLL